MYGQTGALMERAMNNFISSESIDRYETLGLDVKSLAAFSLQTCFKNQYLDTFPKREIIDEGSKRFLKLKIFMHYYEWCAKITIFFRKHIMGLY